MPDPLKTQRLILRNWEERDRDLFFEINNDNKVMKFFPFRRDRKQSDEVMDKISALIKKNGFCFAAIELKQTGECIGFCGLHICGSDIKLPAGTVEIGWRLSPRHWGNGYVTEAALKWLDYGFNKLKLPEIVSFAVPENLASLAVMKRIGMTAKPERDFIHESVPDTHPHLKPHSFYSITKAQWHHSNAKI